MEMADITGMCEGFNVFPDQVMYTNKAVVYVVDVWSPYIAGLDGIRVVTSIMNEVLEYYHLFCKLIQSDNKYTKLLK